MKYFYFVSNKKKKKKNVKNLSVNRKEKYKDQLEFSLSGLLVLVVIVKDNHRHLTSLIERQFKARQYQSTTRKFQKNFIHTSFFYSRWYNSDTNWKTSGLKVERQNVKMQTHSWEINSADDRLSATMSIYIWKAC